MTTRENEVINSKIFVGSLKWEMTESELRELFLSYGDIESVNIVRDKESKKSRGFGFVKFKSLDSAIAALKEMDGKSVNGRALHIEYAEERKTENRKVTMHERVKRDIDKIVLDGMIDQNPESAQELKLPRTGGHRSKSRRARRDKDD